MLMFFMFLHRFKFQLYVHPVEVVATTAGRTTRPPTRAFSNAQGVRFFLGRLRRNRIAPQSTTVDARSVIHDVLHFLRSVRSNTHVIQKKTARCKKAFALRTADSTGVVDPHERSRAASCTASVTNDIPTSSLTLFFKAVLHARKHERHAKLRHRVHQSNSWWNPNHQLRADTRQPPAQKRRIYKR